MNKCDINCFWFYFREYYRKSDDNDELLKLNEDIIIDKFGIKHCTGRIFCDVKNEYITSFNECEYKKNRRICDV